MHGGGRGDALLGKHGEGAQRLREQLARDDDEGAIGLLRAQDGGTLGRLLLVTLVDKTCAGAGRSQRVVVFRVVEEAEVVGAGEVERRHICDELIEPRAVARLRARQRRDLAHGQTLGLLEELSFRHAIAPFAGGSNGRCVPACQWLA